MITESRSESDARDDWKALDGLMFMLLVIGMINVLVVGGLEFPYFRMSVLVILVGAAFRWGGQSNLSIGSSESFPDQKMACESHLDLARHLSSLGLTTRFLVNSYTSQYDSVLKSWYPPDTTWRLHNPFKGYQWLLDDAVSSIPDDMLYTYTGILLIRIDLFVKPEFIAKFELYDKVMFPQATPRLYFEMTLNKRPTVSDMILFIPARHFGYLASKSVSLHECSYNDYNSSDIGFMIRSRHEADSAKDWNPLYRIVNRAEAPNLCDRGWLDHCPGTDSLSAFSGIWDDDPICSKLPNDFKASPQVCRGVLWDAVDRNGLSDELAAELGEFDELTEPSKVADISLVVTIAFVFAQLACL